MGKRFTTIEQTQVVTVDVDIKRLAEIFANMDDEAQAQFFIEVSEISKQWPMGGGMQWHFVGRHLRDCKCSTREARDLVEGLAKGLKPDDEEARQRAAEEQE